MNLKLIIPVLILAFVGGLITAISGLPDRQWSVAGATVLVSIAAAAIGALIGFLIAVPLSKPKTKKARKSAVIAAKCG